MTIDEMTAEVDPVIGIEADSLDVSMIEGTAEVGAVEIETGDDIR
jgi:hypothetical protein